MPYKAAVTDSRNKDVDLFGGGGELLNQPQSFFFFLLAHMVSSRITVTGCYRCRMRRTLMPPTFMKLLPRINH